MEKEQEKAAKAREAALKGALTQIERTFGAGSIMKMGDEAAAVRVHAIPTGALSLDLALGVGGLPRGRIVEIYGPEASGKTTRCPLAIRSWSCSTCCTWRSRSAPTTGHTRRSSALPRP